MAQLVIFTPFEGVLSEVGATTPDHALGALAELGRKEIPIIFVSAMTPAEILTIQRRLEIHAPFIAEEGSAIYVPKGYFPFGFQSDRSTSTNWVIELGTPHRDLRRLLSEVPPIPGLSIRGFGDMGIEEVATLTGLHSHAAARAMVREYGETLVLRGPQDAIEQFGGLVRSRGLRLVPTGGFHLLLGPCNPGLATLVLCSLFVRRHGRIISAALGHSKTDLPLLAAVQYPVLLEGSVRLKEPFKASEKLLPFQAKSWGQGVKHILQKAQEVD